MELTFTNVVTLAATTGIFTAILNQLLSLWRESWLTSRKRKAQGGYHALRLAVLLEAYAYSCADLIQKNSNAETPPDQEFPDWDIKLPELPAYPEDAEGWHAIDLSLAARVLNLRNRISGSQGLILSSVEFSEDELGETVDEEVGERGLEAWEIAVALRRKHGLEPVKPIWDFLEMMETAMHAARKTKDKNRERNAAFFERIAPSAPSSES